MPEAYDDPISPHNAEAYQTADDMSSDLASFCDELRAEISHQLGQIAGSVSASHAQLAGSLQNQLAAQGGQLDATRQQIAGQVWSGISNGISNLNRMIIPLHLPGAPLENQSAVCDVQRMSEPTYQYIPGTSAGAPSPTQPPAQAPILSAPSQESASEVVAPADLVNAPPEVAPSVEPAAEGCPAPVGGPAPAPSPIEIQPVVNVEILERQSHNRPLPDELQIDSTGKITLVYRRPRDATLLSLIHQIQQMIDTTYPPVYADAAADGWK